MNTRLPQLFGRFAWLAGCIGSATSGLAQTPPEFTLIQPLTNKEVRLQLNAPTGRGYRIDASTNLPAWTPLLTLTGATTSLQVTDSAAPFLSTRFYRAEQLSLTNLLTGDHLVTTNGDAIIRAVNHASFVMSWNGLMIYCDPVGGGSPYSSFPRADLILVTHHHSDHFDATTLTAVRKTNGLIIAPIGVYNHASMTPTLRSNTIILGSGIWAGTYPTATNLLNLAVQAVAGTNANHLSGVNNAYVLTLGDKRVFVSGDTGNTAEIRGVPDIDVAFLCMNIPFTMTVNEATNCIRAMRPKVVYPYHYRNQSGTITNAAAFKAFLGTDPGIEVRLRNWY